MLKSKFITALSTACAVLSMTAPVAFAAEGDGVQDNYQEYDSNTSKSGDATTNTPQPQTVGSIQIEYDTNGGWEDPGKDPNTPNDNVNHAAGTFIVTIPTLFKHTGLVAGSVNIIDKYTVNVRGSIRGNQKVELVAQTNRDITSKADSFTETTTQGMTEWTANDTYGKKLAPDGSLLGTDSDDQIQLSGEAKTYGTYTGTVAYTATLVDTDTIALSGQAKTTSGN